ncbi:DUF262 domain-containing protein [Mesorhizobium sp. WSM3860]|uniref:GmrSD restriction endonuclease domain-containing protein n=1 Tax=Mesorhizobium sp. WSM3860 TaxID=2029403 RepID=UPI000BB0553D|nr:DUF262 domain-containing protein [Mesorhizobium sp. WSM3860]PBC05701.1 hypothetical protein CK220_00415 [Mesorhizobium sp. WSM3860]
MVKRLNLDAMIKREDLEISTTGRGSIGSGGIPVSELQTNRLHYGLLRKPSFQRVTNDWDIDNVVTLIKAFRNGSLIPALILWKSEAGYTFVIDGAHRLSAFIAWVNDDYGAGPISRRFFEDKIPKQQKDYADECRHRVVTEVGSYAEISTILQQENPTRERIKWASNIGKPLDAQWVEGDADTAEDSFLAINQRAVEINETEKYMIVSRRKPNVIAARALVRAATGYEYWSKFEETQREEIKRKAKKIYDVLFEPENADLSRSIEMPIAGKPYSAEALRISLDLVNFANDLRAKKSLDELQNDEDGSKTIRFLDKVYGVVKYVSGDGKASLGLHPSVYFWGATKHHPSAFLAMVSFIQHLNSSGQMIDFCFHRAGFEEFLVANDNIVKHILGKYGGWTKSAPSVFEMYKLIFDGLRNGKASSEILAELIADHRFKGLSEVVEIENSPGKRFTNDSRGATRRRELLRSALRCPLCYARLPISALSDDHIVRVQDGGRGDADNDQLTHPYCNTGFKEYLVSSGREFPSRPAFLAEAAE